ncbi:CLUMA_CG000187, isoform A [Clunio marinus]|uniref:CLUMA_CG000187, isoform A n=1 Tax=Clunio marinus TaxID=568069 RepID=A0A1J1HE16_9DIPT|nr:CLUMA_CG000187, isoform A [Clunio marinus]
MRCLITILVAGFICCNCATIERVQRQVFPGSFQFPSTSGNQFGNQFFPPQFNNFNQNQQRPGINQGNQFNQQRPVTNQGNQFNQQRPVTNQGNQQQFNQGNQGGFNNQFPNNQQRPVTNQGNQQQFNQGSQGGLNNQIPNNQQSQNQFTQTTPPAPTPAPTTLAPAVQQCVDTCIARTTSQYNPVCGTDQQNYHNQARLDCARDCGANVSLERVGVCPTRDRGTGNQK